jgi:hypothetical protein
MVKKSRCYLFCGLGLVVGVVAGAVGAAMIGIPAIGHLKKPVA